MVGLINNGAKIDGQSTQILLIEKVNSHMTQIVDGRFGHCKSYGIPLCGVSECPRCEY